MDYIVGEVLYTGPDTRVVVATLPAGATPVVLKLPRADVPHPRTLDKLREEYALLSAVESPGVIRAIALEAPEERPVLVLERWGDVSLDRVLEDGALEVEVALRLGARIARALGHVHRHGILHRDVKPQNILVDADRTDVRLIDFGVATRRSLYVDADAAVETLAGTLAYIAPEQTGRMNRVADARADLYALGATLYQMLTGMLPFETNDALELIHAHIARAPLPPHIRAANRAIPEAVSAIVLKLMEKNPERRYRTAFGAAFDLERAAQQWQESKTVSSWELATRDWEDRVRKPSRLHGRESELSALRQAWTDACGGAVTLSLVAGPSGVGKSALVQELREAVREHSGIFATGKFDLLQRGIPYSALAQALRSIVHRRLGDPPEVLARWKQAWQEAAGPNARILVDLMPEIAHVLGDPAALAELGPIEARNRFQTTVRRFVGTIATAEHPLCLFIDDLQWADPASLLLLHELLTDPDAGHLLVLFAYRDDELDQAHELFALLETLRGKGVSVHGTTLSPLDDEALLSMVADILDQPAEQVLLLSRLVKDKTDGSPFFVGQFLQTLHEQKLLSRDLETGKWQWRREAIEKSAITDNVAALLAHRLTQLPDDARRLLRTAACIGSRFDLAMLSHLEEKAPEQLRSTLEQAVHEGFVVHDGDPSHGCYAFAHDRLEQAAGALIDADESQELHLRIGRRLRDRLAAGTPAETLFDTVHHLNAGSTRILDPAERAELVRLNQSAGQTAKASTAYAAAASFFGAAIALLDGFAWEHAYDLTFLLHRQRAECEYLASRFEQADAQIDELLTRARSDEVRAEAFDLRLRSYLSQNLFMQGVAAGRAGLSLLGIELPDNPDVWEQVTREEEAAIERILSVRPLESLADAPLVSDPRLEMLLQLLGGVGPMAYMAAPKLAPLVMAKHVHLSLARGQTKLSIWGYAFYSFIIASLGRYPFAIRLTRLAAELTEKLGLADVECNVYMQRGTYSAFCEPLRFSLSYLARSQRVGMETGDHFFASLAFLYFPLTQFRLGEPIDTVRAEIERSAAAIQRTKDVMCGVWIVALRQVIDRLQDRNEGRALWNGRLVEAAEWTARMDAQFAGVSCCYHLYKLQFSLFQEDLESALAEVTAVEQRIGYLGNLHWTTDLPFYASLALSAAYPTATPDEQQRYQQALDCHRAKLATLVELCPQNELHRQRLVDAEMARIAGRDHEAIGLYDEAIALARRHGFPHHEALANELCAKFHLANGRAHVGRIYMIEALHGYTRWGAHAVAKRLLMKYPSFFAAALDLPAAPVGLVTAHPAEHAAVRTTTLAGGMATSTGDSALDARLDVASVLRAAQALSGDMVLSSLIGKMLRILSENAGAERAVLALLHEDELRIRAMLTLNPERLELGLDEPILGSQKLPATLVQFVARHREPLVLGQAMSDSRFDDDGYLQSHRPASVLTVPLLHQGRLSGVMYLENPQAANTFPVARVEVVSLLASLAATAIENAALYAEVQRKTEALSSSNERLEQEVREQTAELRAAKEAADNANRAKSDFLTSMSHELRTPLNSVLGYAQVLEQAPELSPENRDRVQILKKSGEHLLTLIEDVLDLAKIEAGRLELIARDIHFPSFVQTLIGLCRVRAEQKGVTFSHEHDGPPLYGIRADEKRLTQVLLNLLANAIKFTRQGGVRFHVEVLEQVPGGKRDMRFHIEDTGPGIAPEQLVRIFDPFEQSGDPMARAEGTGLGLAITKRIVDRMGGSLTVRSELGRGSVFAVALRLPELAQPQIAQDVASLHTVAGYEGPRRMALVVDDSAENRGVVRDMLTPLGFIIAEAESGEDALRAVQERRPDVVVIDLVLPGIDGHETTRRLREMPGMRDAVVLASSAHVSKEQRDRSAQQCHAFLPKPIEASALLSEIERHLGLRWIHKTQAAPSSVPELSDAELCRPSRDVLAMLLDLANKGRVQDLVEQATRLGQQDARLQPWALQLCALADAFQLKKLRTLLQSDIYAATRP